MTYLFVGPAFTHQKRPVRYATKINSLETKIDNGGSAYVGHDFFV